MDEEWRLLIELDADGQLATAGQELIAELGPTIGLHRADGSLVAYADTAEGAAGAKHRLQSALERRALGHLEPKIERWDHAKQEWTGESGGSTEPTDEDEPGSDDDVAYDSEPGGVTPPSSWTVTVSLSHHREAKSLAEELKAEGWNASSSWHTVEVATRSRDDAQTLVTELELRAPGAESQVGAD